MLPVRLAGVGYYLPERRVTNVELEERLHIPAEWIEKVTGVRERRYAGHETSASMGAAAARMALEHAELGVEDLDVIIGASTGAQQAIPCTATFVQRELNAPEGASACFDINATCLSFLFALQNVAHLVAAGVYRTALIYSSEYISPSLNPNERESAVLFGDAAAACVLRRSEPGETSALWHTQFETYNSGATLTEIKGGGTLHHPNNPATTPEMNMFHMRGIAVFKQASMLSVPFMGRFMEGVGWKYEEVDTVVPHQASRHAIEQLTSRLGFTHDQVVDNLAYRGNCVAASIPLTLAEAVHSERIKRGQHVVLCGTGAGLTLGAIAITY